MEEAATSTNHMRPLSKCRDSEPLGVTPLSEHLVNLTSDPREKPFILYVSPQSSSCLILILLITKESRMGLEGVVSLTSQTRYIPLRNSGDGGRGLILI